MLGKAQILYKLFWLLCLPGLFILAFIFSRVRFIKIKDMSEEQRQRLLTPAQYFLVKAADAVQKYIADYNKTVKYFQNNESLKNYNFAEILELSTVIGVTKICIDNMTQSLSYYYDHRKKLEYFLKQKSFNNVMQEILNPVEAYFALDLLKKMKENLENKSQYLLKDDEIEFFKEKMKNFEADFSVEKGAAQ